MTTEQEPLANENSSTPNDSSPKNLSIYLVDVSMDEAPPLNQNVEQAESPKKVEQEAESSKEEEEEEEEQHKCDWCKKAKYEVEVPCDGKHNFCKSCFLSARKELLDKCPGTPDRKCFKTLNEELLIQRGLKKEERISTQTKASPKEIPLVGQVKPTLELQNEYANEIIRFKIIQLDANFKMSQFRGIRGDGNCFYRALAVVLLENIQQHRDALQQLIVAHENFVLERDKKKIGEALKTPTGAADISDFELSQAMVRVLRLLTSYSLSHNEVYSFYFENKSELKKRCESAEKMGEEAEHMEINALLTLLKLTCRLFQLDRTAGDIQVYTLPDDTAQPNFYLLYRPGHYDILYTT